MARRSVVRELWEAQSLVWEQDDRWRAADDAIWKIMHRPHAQHEYLTAQLELAHAHMVGRDVAERAVMAVLDAPRPPKVDAEEARRLLGDLLADYGYHRGGLERAVVRVRDQKEEAERQARRVATPSARVQPAVATVHPARSAGRSLA